MLHGDFPRIANLGRDVFTSGPSGQGNLGHAGARAAVRVIADAGTPANDRTARNHRIVGGIRILRKGMLEGFMTWELEPVKGLNADAA